MGTKNSKLVDKDEESGNNELFLKRSEWDQTPCEFVDNIAV